MKKTLLILILSILAGSVFALAQTVTPTPKVPAWDQIDIVKGLLTIQPSNAEIGTFGDVISRRAFSLLDTNFFKVGKELDLKIGVAGWDTENPVLVYGGGVKITDLIATVSFLKGLVSIELDPLKDLTVSLLTGYNTQTNKWLVGGSLVKDFTLPNLF